MDMIINTVRVIWNDSKRRNKYLLGILIIIWAVTFLNMLGRIFWQRDDGSVATVIVMMCPKCAYKENVPVENDTSSVKCKKCGNPMGLGYKCGDCQFEYGLKDKPVSVGPKSTVEQLVDAQRSTKCPNCGSFSTTPISPK